MTTHGFIALVLMGAQASGLALDPHPDTHGMDMAGYEHYLGNPIISGVYHLDAEGELYISLDRNASGAFPHSEGQPIDIYIGDDALKMLGITRAAEAIDMDHICGLAGHATVELSGLWTGFVADRREYESELVRVISSTPAHLEGCSDVVR